MKTQSIRAILVDVIDPDTSKEDAKNRLRELESLVTTYGGLDVVKIMQKKDKPNYETYIGKGKVKEIIREGYERKAELVIVNNILKPRQIYTLNEAFRDSKMKAWDRIDLILKIFTKHASSSHAKLQIELASIRHMGPRIFGMGMELSRQAGAMGVRAGQGEANIEMMKRHLQRQELSILKKLKHYEVIDEGHRKRRRRKNFRSVALVGYTNAGKSSLLNALTGKGVYVADQLFATLDTRIGKVYDQNNTGYGSEILMSDTIGFIQDLPPTLIKAFKSTLAETVEADLILHVIDVNDPQVHKKVEVVEEILAHLGAHKKPKIYAFSKVDLIAPRSMFDPKFAALKKKSLLKASKGTAELLGWSSKRPEAAKSHINELSEKYKEFNPIFFSAQEKLNLYSIVSKIVAELG
ncbi:MAG: GTPase HflX [bacterium]|nr:GTPase HflX [bacterium]